MLAFVAGCFGAARAFEGQPPLQLGAVAGLAATLAAIIFATYRRN